MTDFDAAVCGFTELDEGVLGRPWPWRSGRMEVRYALYLTLEEAQAAHLRASAAPHLESRRIVALAQRAFGDLCGLLLGLPTERLDQVPRAGQWSVRETLQHVLSVERRYAAQTVYAVERADAASVNFSVPSDRSSICRAISYPCRSVSSTRARISSSALPRFASSNAGRSLMAVQYITT